MSIDPATALPLDLTMLKLDLRISDDALDSVIAGQYIPAALAWAEGFLHRSLLARPHRWIVSAFPHGADQTIYLPRGVVQSITDIEYSLNGSTVTLTGPTSASPAGTNYQEDISGHRARILPNRGESWPSVDSDVPVPVQITYQPGWLTEATIPSDIKRGLTAYVYSSMELDGLLQIRPGFDIEHPDKLISAYRLAEL